MAYRTKKRNGSMRRELLNAYIFNSLDEVRWLSNERLVDYNNERPHKSLGYLSPKAFADPWHELKECTEALSTKGERKPFQIAASRLVDKIIEKLKHH